MNTSCSLIKCNYKLLHSMGSYRCKSEWLYVSVFILFLLITYFYFDYFISEN